MSVEQKRDSVFARCEAADEEVRKGPHAWIQQWKGTDVCMDVRCGCGASFHIDGDFTYYVRCPTCRQLWAMCMNVRMVPVTDADVVGVSSSCIHEP